MIRNVKKKARTKKPPPELEISSTKVLIEEIEKGNSYGKSIVNEKRMSIFYFYVLCNI